jgi:zinc protease
MAAIEAALDSELATLLARGVSHEEVSDAKQRLVADAIFARDSLGGPPRIIGAALATGRSIEDVEAWPDRIGEVTVEQVNAAARDVFGQPFVTGYLLPARSASAKPGQPAPAPVPGGVQSTSMPATLPAPAAAPPAAPGTTAVR